jgi:hypothetical protein
MMQMAHHIGKIGIKMNSKIKELKSLLSEWLSAGEEMLSNGCVLSGHKFWDYGMCSICGEYEDSAMIQRGYSYKDEQIKGRDNV